MCPYFHQQLGEMPNKNYRKGTAFERKITQQLLAAGYYAIGSKGSKGKVDIVAVNQNSQAILIQCKTDGRITTREYEDLIRLGEEFGTTTLLISRPKRGEVLVTVIYSGTGDVPAVAGWLVDE